MKLLVSAVMGLALEPSSGYSFDTPMLWRPR